MDDNRFGHLGLPCERSCHIAGKGGVVPDNYLCPAPYYRRPFFGSGSSFSLEVVVNYDCVDFTGGSFSFQYTLAYDTAVLTATGASSSDAFIIPSIDDGAGTVSVRGFQSFFTVLCPVVFHIVHDFAVDSVGTSALHLQNSITCQTVFEEKCTVPTTSDGSFSNVPSKSPPTAVINGPAKVTEGDNMVYDGSKSFDNSSPPQALSYEWVDKTNGVLLGNGVEQKVTFGPPGTLLLSLTVCNESNLCGRTELLITINERKLPATADLVPPKGSAAYATERVTFTIRIFTGTPSFTCGLGFGDGNAMSITPCLDGEVVSHVYVLPGTYTATLNVTDANGSFTSSSEDVTVQPEPLFFRGKLSWKHHLTVVTQTFSAKITNPSKYNALVTVTITFIAPDGTVPSPPASRTFKLGPMSSNTDAQIFFDATMLGKYCFTATLTYQVDVNATVSST